mgnify:CR=1 FL=1
MTVWHLKTHHLFKLRQETRSELAADLAASFITVYRPQPPPTGDCEGMLRFPQCSEMKSTLITQPYFDENVLVFEESIISK